MALCLGFRGSLESRLGSGLRVYRVYSDFPIYPGCSGRRPFLGGIRGIWVYHVYLGSILDPN